MKPIVFPRDEQAHDKIIEWWYWNGHLTDEDGNQYAYMDCLFQAKPNKVKLPFIKLPMRRTYFSHSIISDVKRQKASSTIDYLSLISEDSFKQSLLFVNYIGVSLLEGYVVSEMIETAPFKYKLRAKNLDLNLVSTKKPLLENGNGYLDMGNRSTYYYSLTNLKTEGTLMIDGKKIKVKGKSWMDHQWADAPYEKDEWNWFCIQLEDNTELVCFEYLSQKKRRGFASISYPNGKSENFSDVAFVPVGKEWISPKTKARYPLSWEIVIPEKKLILQVEPMIKSQELIFSTINYWEGPLSVKGSFSGKKVSGLGFLELVGRPSQYGGYKFLKENVSVTLKALQEKLKQWK